MVAVPSPQAASLGGLASSKLPSHCFAVHPLISLWCRGPIASLAWLLLHGLASVAGGCTSALGALLGRSKVLDIADVSIQC
jgi:hypothetical protein